VPGLVPGASGETGISFDCGTVFGLDELKFGVGGDGCGGAGAPYAGAVPLAGGAEFAACAPSTSINAPMMDTHPTTTNAVNAIRSSRFIVSWSLRFIIAGSVTQYGRRTFPGRPGRRTSAFVYWLGWMRGPESVEWEEDAILSERVRCSKYIQNGRRTIVRICRA
jgi:hypothetical protein